MVTAIVLIGADRGKVNPLAEALAERAEVSEVYSVSGSYDLIAIIRVGSNDELAGFVTDFMANLDGIAHTETMLAFRAHSRHDLEAMFGIGVESKFGMDPES